MADYPNSVTSFTTKATDDVVEAAHVNDLQDEVTAIETALIDGIPHNLTPSSSGSIDLGSTLLKWRIGWFSDALILNAATTSGARMDLESGLLAFREGDDSAYLGVNLLSAAFSGRAATDVSIRKTGSATIGMRLGDDSGYANIEAMSVNAVGGSVFVNGSAVGDIRLAKTGAGTLGIRLGDNSAYATLETGITNITGALLVSSALRAAGTPSTATLAAGDNNNLAPTGGISGTTLVDITPDAGGTSVITGITAGSDNQILYLRNVGAAQFAFTHEDTDSTDVNRFLTSSQNHACLRGGMIQIMYNSTLQRWQHVYGGS